MSDSLQPHGLQHTRLPCPSPLWELDQAQVHRIGDAIQPSHPLSSPSLPAFNLAQHRGLFQFKTPTLSLLYPLSPFGIVSLFFMSVSPHFTVSELRHHWEWLKSSLKVFKTRGILLCLRPVWRQELCLLTISLTFTTKTSPERETWC